MDEVTDQPKRPSTGPTSRRVALRLAGLADADRRWILARLTPDQRLEVEEAGRQLHAIKGNARLDFDLILAASSAGRVGDGGKSPGTAPPEPAVNGVSYPAVKAVLDELPDVHVAAVLSSGIWRGGKRYLNDCGKRRRRVLASAGRPGLTEASMRSLLDAVAKLAGENDG